MAEENKKSLVKIIIIAIAALIFFLWLANLRNVLSGAPSDENIWNKFNQELDRSMEQADAILNQGREEQDFVKDLLERASSTEAISSSTKIENISEELKEELSEIIKTASSTLINYQGDNYSAPGSIGGGYSIPTPVDASYSIPTPVKETNKSCPEYINCMPTIGETRSCVIPPGCEGITLIAY